MFYQQVCFILLQHGFNTIIHMCACDGSSAYLYVCLVFLVCEFYQQHTKKFLLNEQQWHKSGVNGSMLSIYLSTVFGPEIHFSEKVGLLNQTCVVILYRPFKQHPIDNPIQITALQVSFFVSSMLASGLFQNDPDLHST